MSTVRYLAKIQHMAQADILAMIPPSEMERIKAVDPHPIIRVFGVGHEGNASGSILGTGARQMVYLREAIEAMYAKIQHGLKAFFGHGEGTNSHAGRQDVGEIVGKSMVERDGGLFNMVAVWIKDRAKADSFDVASIEADVLYEKRADGIAVQDIIGVSGLALGNSANDTPGFPGATLIASMQAFAEKEPQTMKLSEIQDAIREAGLKPGDLFSKTVLRQDDTIRELQKEHSEKEFEHRTKVESLLEEAKAKLKAFDGVDVESLKARAAKAVKLEASTMADAAIKGAKLSEKMAAFVRKRFDSSFKIPDDADAAVLEKAIADHIANESNEFKSMAEVFGVKLDELPSGGTGPGGDGTDNKPDPFESLGDLSDPANNPAIPKKA
jgi:hypothetical protein